MAISKAVLWKQANKAGNFPIKIRITKDGKPRYAGTGYSIRERDWHPKKGQVKYSNLEHEIINEKIRVLLTRAQQAETEMVLNDEVVTARKLKNRTKGKSE